MFVFQCTNCEISPCYLLEVRGEVLCSSCYTFGVAQELTEEEINELDFPVSSSVELGDFNG
jgi:hypothetical protein